MKKSFITALAMLACALGAAQAQGVYTIGEINSYQAQPVLLEPYRKGMELAVAQVNATGGIGGKKLALITRDDNANPADAVRAAEELIGRDKVDLLMGGLQSDVALALADFALQKKRFFLATEPLTDRLVWSQGNRYTFRLRPSAYMQVAMLVPEAAAMKKRRWALVYPNDEYGQSAVATFKRLLKAAQPDVEFVTEQAVPPGKADAAGVVQALQDARPEAIFNALLEADLASFVHAGSARGLFQGRGVVSLLTGEPEQLDPLKGAAPQGWVVTGYPWYAIFAPDHDAFVTIYRKRFKDYPRAGSMLGYNAIQSLAAGLRKAGSADTEKLIAAFRGLEVRTPLGPITYRAQDHQSTMGAYVGTIGLYGGKGVMVDFKYLDGARFQPTDAEVQKLRPNR
ncbi:MAG TPA: ABC transporter substrate-binding protein [Alicycliphilus sp.]|nr:ABC transporter substrate-binding protein [Alicycliphilus sp.]